MRERQQQTGQQLAAPREPTLGERMVTKPSKERNDVLLVLEDLSAPNRPFQCGCFATCRDRLTALPSLQMKVLIKAA